MVNLGNVPRLKFLTIVKFYKKPRVGRIPVTVTIRFGGGFDPIAPDTAQTHHVTHGAGLYAEIGIYGVSTGYP